MPLAFTRLSTHASAIPAYAKAVISHFSQSSLPCIVYADLICCFMTHTANVRLAARPQKLQLTPLQVKKCPGSRYSTKPLICAACTHHAECSAPCV